MLGGFLGCFVHAHCKAGSTSTLLSHSVSVPMHVLHHHPCTSQCPQHHAAPTCAQLRPCREGSGDGVNVPNSFSAHKQHKGERGRREGGRKGISLFSILNSSLLECGCAAIPPAWMSLGGKGCDCPAKGFFLSFLGLAFIVGADLTSSAASRCALSDRCNPGTP